MPLKRAFRRRKASAAPAGERLYAVGDIHGRLDLFESLLGQIERDDKERGPARTTVILLGDLVDRGPDSRAVVERAMQFRADWAQLECLMGNHEASMLSVLRGETRWFASWLGFGGYETLQSYGVSSQILAEAGEAEIAEAARDAVPAAHRRWLEDRPLKIAKGDYQFVHAGIRPGVAFEDQQARDLLWIRHDFLDSKADHGAIVVHGHSITSDVEERANRIGIDTGAYFSNKLTALGLESDDRWFLQTDG